MRSKPIELTVDGLKISGRLYLPDNVLPPYQTVILCHGVPFGGIIDPTDGGYPALAETLVGEGLAAVTFSFRGTGISEGNFDVLGWTRDLAAIIDYQWANPEIDKTRISLVGFSAGATVSVYVAARDKRISAVAACACPADFSAISNPKNTQYSLERFRQIGIIRDPNYPPSLEEWLADFCKVNALQSVGDISPRPLLLVHAREDPVVAVSNSEKLYQRAGQPKQMVIIGGSEHRLRRNPAAVDAILRWLKSPPAR